MGLWHRLNDPKLCVLGNVPKEVADVVVAAAAVVAATATTAINPVWLLLLTLFCLANDLVTQIIKSKVRTLEAIAHVMTEY